jgi:LacI family transcriptional regulator
VTAVAGRGLDGAEAVAVAEGYSRPADAAAAGRLLERRPDLTALACANDLLALGAYDALAGAGRACRRTSRWSGTTTCRWWTWWRRR